MKFSVALVALVTMAASASAHMGMLYPTPRGGYGTKQYNGRFHAFIGYKDSKANIRFPCGGFAPGPITNLKAGQRIDVRFFASGMKASEIKTQPRPGSRNFYQARHGGGLCEFSLSYNNGKTYHKIGEYSKTCPDAMYKWPVKIPDNVPNCKSQGCLFVWSWTANILPQYYHNCADIRLTGGSGKGKLSKKGIQIVDFSPYKKNVVAPGDGIKHSMGKGPMPGEIKNNLLGKYNV